MSEDSMNKEEAAALVRDYVSKGRTTESLLKLYDETADKYDKMLSSSAYNGPAVLADRVSRLMGGRRDVRIMDVGAGSGMSGEELNKAGFSRIDALDGSQGMLDIAKAKGVYGQLFCEMIGGGTDTDVTKGSYDLAVSAGAFQENHLPKNALRTMIQLVKPGGYVVNVMRETTPHLTYYGDGLDPYMTQLEAEGLWKEESKELFPGYIGSGSGSPGGVAYIHKVL